MSTTPPTIEELREAVEFFARKYPPSTHGRQILSDALSELERSRAAVVALTEALERHAKSCFAGDLECDFSPPCNGQCLRCLTRELLTKHRPGGKP